MASFLKPISTKFGINSKVIFDNEVYLIEFDNKVKMCITRVSVTMQEIVISNKSEKGRAATFKLTKTFMPFDSNDNIALHHSTWGSSGCLILMMSLSVVEHNNDTRYIISASSF